MGHIMKVPSMCVVFGGLPGLLPTLKPVQLPRLELDQSGWITCCCLWFLSQLLTAVRVGLGCLGGGSRIEPSGLDKMWLNQLAGCEV